MHMHEVAKLMCAFEFLHPNEILNERGETLDSILCNSRNLQFKLQVLLHL
jgi:hypothetical protein